MPWSGQLLRRFLVENHAYSEMELGRIILQCLFRPYIQLPYIEYREQITGIADHARLNSSYGTGHGQPSVCPVFSRFQVTRVVGMEASHGFGIPLDSALLVYRVGEHFK